MKKKLFKNILIGLGVILVAIQFFRPTRNLGADTGHDITTKFKVPDSVQQILKTSCNDCHSNSTMYPWYTNLQPVGWWLQHHINEGKRGLNFSEFATYRIAKQYDRFKGIEKLVKEEEMPLKSYTLIHRYAILNDVQKDVLIKWAVAEQDSFKANYPADSLVMPKRRGPKKS